MSNFDSSSDWADWGSDEGQSPNSDLQSSNTQNDGWGSPSNEDWGADSTDWGTNSTNWGTSSDDDWGIETDSTEPDNTSNFIDSSSDAEWEQNYDNQPIQEKMPSKQFNLGYKAVGLIVGALILLVALVLLFFDSIHITKKQQVPAQSTNTTQVAQQTQVQQQTQQTTQSAVNTANGSVVMIQIPDSTSLNYAGDIYEVSGTVASKLKYVQGNQVLYCIVVRVAVGSSAEDLNYYCNYASYQAVGVGDLVKVKYQQVSDGYISINEIFK